MARTAKDSLNPKGCTAEILVVYKKSLLDVQPFNPMFLEFFNLKYYTESKFSKYVC